MAIAGDVTTFTVQNAIPDLNGLTPAPRTPLWLTNADEVGRNILRVRPRGCGRGNRMLCCHDDRV